ncbi:MAG: hypothetical protein ACLP19_06755, partial [Xanthobacteraceae bacterium]
MTFLLVPVLFLNAVPGGKHRMGYDLHITRKKNWDGFEDEHGPEISLDEWIAMVRADAEMRLDGFCEVRLPHGKVFRLDRPSIAVWTAWSHHGEAG